MLGWDGAACSASGSAQQNHDSVSFGTGRRLVSTPGFDGVPVVSPNALAAMPRVPILIGTLIHHMSVEERIREMGLPNRVVRLSVS